MEINWVTVVDPRQTYVSSTPSMQRLLMPFRPYSWLRKEHPPVCGTSMTVLDLIYTITSSAIIEDVEGMRAAGLAAVAYYYFDFRDTKKQGRYGLLSSLVSQLSAELNSCYEVLSRLYSDNAGGTRKPTSLALTRCIKDMLRLPGQDQIYIIIDALDECPNISGTPSAREEVLELVKELVDLKLPNVHICVTSRPEIDIRTVLDQLRPSQISLHEEKGQEEDIIKYIKSVVHTDMKMRKWKKETQELVIDTLSEKAGGM